MDIGRLIDDNLVDLAALDGPESWVLPVSHLAHPRMRSRPARCVTEDPAEMVFTATFDRPHPVGAIAICAHTLEMDATWRAVGYAGEIGGEMVYDTGDLPAFPAWHASVDLPWSHPSLWSGRPTARDIGGYTPHLVHVLPQAATAAAWSFSFGNPTGPGWFDLGYLMIGSVLSPAWGFAWSRERSADWRDLVDRSAGGAPLAQEMRPARLQNVTWQHLTEAEARRLHDAMIRRRGVHPVFLVPDSRATLDLSRDCWPGLLRSPPRMRMAQTGDDGIEWSVTVELEELVA